MPRWIGMGSSGPRILRGISDTVPRSVSIACIDSLSYESINDSVATIAAIDFT